MAEPKDRRSLVDDARLAEIRRGDARLASAPCVRFLLDHIDTLTARLGRAEDECKVWMNAVADAVESLGYSREAACGPSDLLPGLLDLTAERAALRAALTGLHTARGKETMRVWDRAWRLVPQPEKTDGPVGPVTT